MKAKSIALLTLLASGVLMGIGGYLFMYLGLYDIGATTPHTPLFIKVITFAKERTVKIRASNIKERNLLDEKLIKRGFKLYQEKCVVCHGGPGVAPTAQVQGLNPNVPPLENSARSWRAREIAWIIKNGFKMTGMPGFELGENSTDLWALTAFVKRMNTLSVDDYAAMMNETLAPKDWLPSPQGFKIMAQRGDGERGRKLLKSYGCGACHIISGVAGATGKVGAPLDVWQERHYLVGKFINNPFNLVKWIQAPDSMEPKTIMPNLGVKEDEAWDMASYLFSLEGD